MKNNSYIPYNFDFKYEYKTYKNIGKENKIQYKAGNNVLYRLYWLIRKVFNRNEKKYKNLNDFSEWEKYVNQTRLGDNYNKKDFIFFLEGSSRGCDVNRNIIGSIVTPIYAIFLSGILTILLNNNQPTENCNQGLFAWIFFNVFIICVLIFLMKINYRRNSLYYFYIDYIKLIEKHEVNNKRESSAETGKTEETNIKNETNTASEAVETKNYREYVVRVYDK